MSRILQAKRDNPDAVGRALALALRSPTAVAAAKRPRPAKVSTRHGQRANRVPLTRQGKPHV